MRGVTRSFAVVCSCLVLLGACSPASYVEDNSARDRVLAAHFTPEAAEMLDDVPLRVGELGDNIIGLAVGNDLLSQLVALLFGYPMEPQVVVATADDEELILHEYIHQAEYAGLLSRAELAEALAAPGLAPEAQVLAGRVRGEIEAAYGEGLLSALSLIVDPGGINRELLAALAERYVFDSERVWPPELAAVYADTLLID